jgi:hypothetical protein
MLMFEADNIISNSSIAYIRKYWNIQYDTRGVYFNVFSSNIFFIELKMSSKCAHKMLNKDRIIQIVMVFGKFTVLTFIDTFMLASL